MKQSEYIIKSKSLGRNQYEKIRRDVFRGDMIRLKNGRYCSLENMFSVSYDIENIVPDGIMCMWSAWYYYDLCDVIPTATCVAVSSHRNVRVPEYPKYNVYYRTENILNIGVTNGYVSGISFKIYDLERVVADSVKYRNKIGYDTMAEIFRNYIRRTDKNTKKLIEYSRILRIEKTVKNLLLLYNG